MEAKLSSSVITESRVKKAPQQKNPSLGSARQVVILVRELVILSFLASWTRERIYLYKSPELFSLVG